MSSNHGSSRQIAVKCLGWASVPVSYSKLDYLLLLRWGQSLSVHFWVDWCWLHDRQNSNYIMGRSRDIPGVGRPYQSTTKQQRWFRVKASLGNPSFGCPKKWLRNEKCIHMHALHTQKSNMKPGQEPTYHSFTPMASHLDAPSTSVDNTHRRSITKTSQHPATRQSSCPAFYTIGPPLLPLGRTGGRCGSQAKDGWVMFLIEPLDSRCNQNSVVWGW